MQGGDVPLRKVVVCPKLTSQVLGIMGCAFLLQHYPISKFQWLPFQISNKLNASSVKLFLVYVCKYI